MISVFLRASSTIFEILLFHQETGLVYHIFRVLQVGNNGSQCFIWLNGPQLCLMALYKIFVYM